MDVHEFVKECSVVSSTIDSRAFVVSTKGMCTRDLSYDGNGSWPFWDADSPAHGMSRYSGEWRGIDFHVLSRSRVLVIFEGIE
jgi:hypothetical protein